ncbi:hypothetical protein PDE_04550 [Penicillium oxalicum 114-2]|uniref:Myb-like DNA-binding domain-containing protein n=1 Tax=Penicillium oxalicum (strain 114-2 / CGMCC 5302) TaxID=933388 RepID=S7ZFY7_PENO1|nr:hypothetical protein PDE_04550 [Penicillium oxalicum 114-2]
MPSKNSMPSPQKSAPKPVTQGSELAENLENAFLAMCLRHLNMETKKVDACAVAEALGYSNAKSAGNRFCALRKKYNLRDEMPQTKSSAKTTTNKVQKTPTKRGGNKKINSSPESQRENDFETEDFAETGVSGSMESYVEENDGDDEGGVSTGLKKENEEYETSDY